MICEARAGLDSVLLLNSLVLFIQFMFYRHNAVTLTFNGMSLYVIGMVLSKD